jgi:hypothetical protein
VLLDFFLQVLKNERIEVRSGFFDEWLKGGRAAILLDGLDEVADPDLRRRVSRLVDAFTRAYDRCRFVVTSPLFSDEGEGACLFACATHPCEASVSITPIYGVLSGNCIIIVM